jgi:hypothetical protein
MTELAVSLAKRARRAALIQAVRGRPELTIGQLDALLANGDYAAELSQITIDELLSAEDLGTALVVRQGESLEQAVLRVFEQLPGRPLASGFFCRYMGLERWTAQKLLADMAEAGLLIRSGKTSGTRYRLATPRSQRMTPPRDEPMTITVRPRSA